MCKFTRRDNAFFMRNIQPGEEGCDGLLSWGEVKCI
jgi:hypothetical protein